MKKHKHTARDILLIVIFLAGGLGFAGLAGATTILWLIPTFICIIAFAHFAPWSQNT